MRKLLVDNQYHKIEIVEGVLVSTWKSDFIDLAIAKKMAGGRLEATKGKKYPFLVKIDALSEITQEARDFFASRDATEDVIISAICATSVLESYIANFFIKVNKPSFHAEVFTDETLAINWLSQYVKNDEKPIVEKKVKLKTLLDDDFHKIDLEDGILIATWKVSKIDISAAKEVSASRHKLTSGKKYPILVKMNSIKESTVEARDFLASEEACIDIIATALCVDSVLGDYNSSFFISINKPAIPIKIFNDEAKAKEWLEQFVVNNN